MELTQEEFQRISRLLKERYGLDMSRKKEIMNGRLENYIRQSGWDTYHAYMNALEQDFTGELERKLVNLLTTNHTYFMRESDHFEFLENVVLPELRKREERKRDLCIWCGAASTGEEPYTLAMILKDFFGLEAGYWDTKVLATDISTEVLAHAVAGIYSRERIEVLPKQWINRYFRATSDGESYVVTQELKQEVLFRVFNLMDPFPFKRKMHVIFLRNVMIYFDKATKQELVQKVYDCMEPGGYLFIGQTENIDRTQIPFELVHASVYRKPI